MAINIIEYNRSYKEELIEFILSIQKNEFNIKIDRDDQPDLENIEHNYLNNGGQFWLAINNHQNIVGTIGLIRLDNNMSALKKMFVDKGYRNLKIGKKLLDKVIMTCKEQNIDGIYLGTIDKFISAQYFYSNNGFREIRRGDLPSSFPKLDVDNRFYYRNLKD
ncbi:Acetyltransferase, GNAT family [Staphylococcus aureus]|nr:Acetyltransferase, GNAT family [Staphylococcus aureus]